MEVMRGARTSGGELTAVLQDPRYSEVEGWNECSNECGDESYQCRVASIPDEIVVVDRIY